jgi:pimeloyl-ACP methyl ester carboxylesterase
VDGNPGGVLVNDPVNFRSHKVQLSDVNLHFVEAGSTDSPPLILLHGWPQTWREWSAVMPALAAHHWVIAPDMRGLGDSSRPKQGYDARSVAGDIVELMDHLNIPSMRLVGHDLGALVAYALASGWRDRVSELAIIDVILPGFGLEKLVQLRPAGGWGIWHFPFHAASDIAEYLIAGREREYMRWFFRNMAYNPDAISPEQENEYVRAYSQPGAMRAGLSYYRAFYEDGVQNREAGAVKLKIPVLALGGSASVGKMVGDEMSIVAEQVTGDVVPNSGHWIPEEQPEWLAKRLLTFFVSS